MYEASENFCLNLFSRQIHRRYIFGNDYYSLYFEILTQSAEICGNFITIITFPKAFVIKGDFTRYYEED